MLSLRRSVIFFSLIAFCFAQVFWWSFYATRRANELRHAAEALGNRRFDDIAQAFGARTPMELREIADRQSRMFLLESGTFALLILLVGGMFWRTLRREDEIRKGQDRFLAGATHELKTPLATLKLGLESLGNDRLPLDARREYLAQLLPEVDRLTTGIDNVLTAAGLRVARPNLQCVVADLREDALRAIEVMRNPSENHGVRLELHACEPVFVRRDAGSMRIVFHNLLDNAIRYSAENSTCTISLAATEHEVSCRIADEGRGMTPDECRQAFEAFWRGREDHVGGTGLGLHLARELVRAHGGEITLESPGAGQGTVAEITLPRVHDTTSTES
ncbi:MAG: HAMP domain-containing histidine kinase [Planctomycetes bacterium]|nr:HAMP domain-containing histidine kinase [Planctomycetota bacterium]